MQLKHAILALAAAGMLSGQAYAAETQVAAVGAQPVADFSQADLQALFEQDAKPMQLAALSEQEMRETEGAVIWFAPVAFAGFRYALTGFTRHGLNQIISRGGVGVSNRAILSTLRNPTTIYSDIARKTTRFEGPEATVVLNQNGKLVTAWGKPR
jgi:hypothetical protein